MALLKVVTTKSKFSKEMLFIDEVDDKNFLTGLFGAMYDELPAPKKKK